MHNKLWLMAVAAIAIGCSPDGATGVRETVDPRTAELRKVEELIARLEADAADRAQQWVSFDPEGDAKRGKLLVDARRDAVRLRNKLQRGGIFASALCDGEQGCTGEGEEGGEGSGGGSGGETGAVTLNAEVHPWPELKDYILITSVANGPLRNMNHGGSHQYFLVRGNQWTSPGTVPGGTYIGTDVQRMQHTFSAPHGYNLGADTIVMRADGVHDGHYIPGHLGYAEPVFLGPIYTSQSVEVRPGMTAPPPPGGGGSGGGGTVKCYALLRWEWDVEMGTLEYEIVAVWCEA